MNSKNKFLDFLRNLDIIIACIALTVLIFITFFGVIMRYFLGQPFVWQEEVQLMCLVWIIFMASGAAFRYGNHVMIEMVVDMLPQKAARVVAVVDLILGLLILGFIGFQSYALVSTLAASGRATNILDIPYALIYSVVPIGFVLMMINLIITSMNDIRGISNDDVEKGENI